MILFTLPRLVPLIFLLLAIPLAFFRLSTFQDLVFSDFQVSDHIPGIVDFREYWCAKLIAGRGLDFYDREVVSLVQKTEMQAESALMMWNPPWLLTLFSPVLSLDYQTSARLWFLLSFCLGVLAGFLACRFCFPKKSAFACLALGFAILALCEPFWLTLEFGQIGNVLFFGVLCAIWGVKKESAFLLGLAALLLTLKIHLFSLFAVFLFFYLMRERKLGLLFRAAGFFALVVLLTELLYPGSLQNWWQAMQGRDIVQNIPSPQLWVTAAPLSALYSIFAPPVPRSFWLYMPWLIAIAFFAWSACTARLSFERGVLLSLAASLLFTPFMWGFDLSFLILPSLLVCSLLLEAAPHARRDLILGSLTLLYLLINLALYVHLQVFRISQHHFMFWFPACFGILLLVLGLFSSQKKTLVESSQ